MNIISNTNVYDIHIILFLISMQSGEAEMIIPTTQKGKPSLKVFINYTATDTARIQIRMLLSVSKVGSWSLGNTTDFAEGQTPSNRFSHWTFHFPRGIPFFKKWHFDLFSPRFNLTFTSQKLHKSYSLLLSFFHISYIYSILKS